jgi:hypothetical protein
MLELEQMRLRNTTLDLRNQGLIFPIVFRGLECLPAEIRDHRQYENFDHVTVETDFRRRDCQLRLKNLAERIFSRYQTLHNAGIFQSHDCGSFRLPQLDSIRDWLEAIAPIRPFRMPGH